MLLKQKQRAFSTAVARQGQAALQTNATFPTLWEVSDKEASEKVEKVAAEQSYLNGLKAMNVSRGQFSHFQADASDIPEISKIKSRINQVVERELVHQDFKDQYSKEELAGSVYNEVISRKNFFFEVDEQKREKNLALANLKAPGNKFRKPSCILPHEHITSTGYLDTTGLTADKEWELYGYYAFMVDLHIAQIRPDNLEGVSYVPKRFNQVERTKQFDTHLNNRFFEYYHRWREPTRTWFSQTMELNFQEQLKNRATTTHYDHDKGTKYDVEWTDEQKFPHVANRLGYPILKEEPIERIFGIERAPAHPGYQLQPFVQTPAMEPDADLSFKQGEVIYENRGVVEWTRFWKCMTAIVFGASPGFYVFEMYAGDGTPSTDWIADNWNWWNIPKQFQDASGWGVEEYRYCDDREYMNMQYGGKRGFARPMHAGYMLQVLILLQHMNFDYVSKMVYNKDKDLVFVYKPTGLWNEQEYVYEMHHLEQMVPYAVTAIKNMSMQRDDGIVTVYCMNTKDSLKFYGDSKYWNLGCRDEFHAQTRGLWKGNFDNKYTGSIFSVNCRANIEETLSQIKVESELNDAIKKHGEVVIPATFEDEWEERLIQEKQKIASNQGL